MKRLQAAVAVAALLAAGPAFAQATPAGETGLQLGARASFAWPFGDAFDVPGAQRSADFTGELGDSIDWAVPIWAELNYRLNRDLAVGVYAKYAFIEEADIAGFDPPDVTNWHLGAQLTFRLAEMGTILPWVGVGAGWEWLSFDDTPDFDSPDLDGFEALVQAGADFKVAQGFNVGPFVAFTVGNFGEVDFGDGDTFDSAWHEWLEVGIRGTFDF
jgi:hypothetical protein